MAAASVVPTLIFASGSRVPVAKGARAEDASAFASMVSDTKKSDASQLPSGMIRTSSGRTRALTEVRDPTGSSGKLPVLRNDGRSAVAAPRSDKRAGASADKASSSADGGPAVSSPTATSEPADSAQAAQAGNPGAAPSPAPAQGATPVVSSSAGTPQEAAFAAAVTAQSNQAASQIATDKSVPVVNIGSSSANSPAASIIPDSRNAGSAGAAQVGPGQASAEPADAGQARIRPEAAGPATAAEVQTPSAPPAPAVVVAAPPDPAIGALDPVQGAPPSPDAVLGNAASGQASPPAAAVTTETLAAAGMGQAASTILPPAVSVGGPAAAPGGVTRAGQPVSKGPGVMARNSEARDDANVFPGDLPPLTMGARNVTPTASIPASGGETPQGDGAGKVVVAPTAVHVDAPSGTDAGSLAALQNTAAGPVSQAVTGTAAPSAALSASVLPGQTHTLLAMQLARAVQDGSSTLSVELHPADLGRVEVHLSFHADGVGVQMTLDRRETFDAFTQDRAALEKQFSQAGIDLGSGGLDLRFGENQGQSMTRDASPTRSFPGLMPQPVSDGRAVPVTVRSGLIDILA